MRFSGVICRGFSSVPSFYSSSCPKSLRACGLLCGGAVASGDYRRAYPRGFTSDVCKHQCSCVNRKVVTNVEPWERHRLRMTHRMTLCFSLLLLNLVHPPCRVLQRCWPRAHLLSSGAWVWRCVCLTFPARTQQLEPLTWAYRVGRSTAEPKRCFVFVLFFAKRSVKKTK